MAESFQFQFLRGLTTSVSFQYQTLNPDGTQVPINLTGKVVGIYFRRNNAAANLLELRSDQGPSANGSQLIITDAAAGKWDVKVTNEETASAAFADGHGTWWTIVDDGTDPVQLHSDTFTISESYDIP